MSRFFVDAASVGSDRIYITDKGDIKHIKNVLRLKVGDEIEVSDSSEWEYFCLIDSIDSDEVQAVIQDKQKFAGEPELRVTLFQGVPKGSKMDDIVRKCTELGASAMVPVFMDRSVVKDNGSYGKKVERMRTIAAEASKQCRRGIVPDIGDPVKLKDLPGILADYELIILPYENEEGYTIKDSLKGIESGVKNVAVIIGPEGGFSEAEVELLTKAGAKSVSLGKTILRTETAGIAAIAMIMYELEL